MRFVLFVSAVMAGFRGRVRQKVGTRDTAVEASRPGGPASSSSRSAPNRSGGSLSGIVRGKMLQVGAALGFPLPVSA